MFKVICDVKLLPSNSWHDDFPNHNIAHAALKYRRIIGYNNCTACDIGSLKLTSASDVPRHSEMLTLIKRWSINILDLLHNHIN
ncbi:hypothetical protein [Candidatus Lariskella endosymbiont of Epinotia ramella]|uniref:hypothetical protein n=1 Tax=Candidatus Lariskella endosymbiont of Epinotia ramella TaxID=3066224 RepID=UPI0030D4021D